MSAFDETIRSVQSDTRLRSSRTPRGSPKVISDLDPNMPVSDAEIRLVTAMLGDVIDHILDAE